MSERPKIAVICTVYWRRSHAQNIVDRFLEGYGWGGKYHKPAVDVVSVYVAQIGDNDLTDDRIKRFGYLKRYPTIAEALACGGSKLAVDGVLLIGEHGDYERNEKGQKLYPRYEFFTEMVKVFKASGRSVPVFNDKHLSWNWDWAREMYDTSKRLGFAFMAGSCLPVTRRLPPIETPMGAELEEGLCHGVGSVDVSDFHSLESLQCMVERRAGGETGIRHVETYRGERFWNAYEDEIWSHKLLVSALARSDRTFLSRPGRNYVWPSLDEFRKGVPDPIAYHYEHCDGLKCTMILLNGWCQDINVALRIKGKVDPLSTQFFLPYYQKEDCNHANFFNSLCYNIEKMFLTGTPSYPVERTLLTTGLTAACVESLYRDQARIETPHLDIAYEPTVESTFWRN